MREKGPESIVVKKFGINNRHARTLRWQFKKIGHLAINLSKIYSYKNQLEALFKNHSALANETNLNQCSRISIHF